MKKIKTFDFTVKQVGDPEQRTLEFLGSTAAVDRYGDVVEMDGWELANFMKNPVFLWAHDYNQPPIGKAVAVEKTADGLKFQIEFAGKDVYPFADTIYKLYQGGFMRATSVGFAGLEYEPIKNEKGDSTGGLRFKKQELYELSAVPVPANPDAVMLAVQKGIISDREAEQWQGTIEAQEHIARLAAQAPAEAPDLEAQVKALTDRIEALNARLIELEAAQENDGTPAWVKDFVETITALQRSALKALTPPEGGPETTGLYERLLAPGQEPSGEGAADNPAMADIAKLTKQLTALFTK